MSFEQKEGAALLYTSRWSRVRGHYGEEKVEFVELKGKNGIYAAYRSHFSPFNIQIFAGSITKVFLQSLLLYGACVFAFRCYFQL